MSHGYAPSVVVMGVSGSGKSSVGVQLAERVGGVYLDADDLHSSDARAKMASGVPLTDADREPWLDRVAETIRERGAAAQRSIVACSALRRVYRDRLRAGSGGALVFVHLVGDESTLRSRLGARSGHFMPSTLLASQLATLEPLDPDEDGFEVAVDEDLQIVVDRAAARLAMPRA